MIQISILIFPSSIPCLSQILPAQDMEGFDVSAQRWLVFGANGYVGKRLIERLRALGATEVFGCDVRLGQDSKTLIGDIRDQSYVEKCFATAQPNCVVHLASFGMSGGEMAQRALTWDINVRGTQLVSAACVRHRAQLVYVSTVNVCFSGREEIIDGDEQMSRAPASHHSDAYSASKAAAEEVAFASGALCVAIRPYGIYGQGEERHFPRMLSLFKWGMFARFGNPKGDLTDWVHVDNLVHAMLLGHARMEQCQGKGYFVGDGEPTNTINLCTPLWQFVAGSEASLGPWIPFSVVYAVAWLCEIVRVPLLSRTEVCKVARTHYWRTDRLCSELGYRPVISRTQGLNLMYQHFEALLIQQGYPHRYQLFRNRIIFLFSALFILLILWLFA